MSSYIRRFRTYLRKNDLAKGLFLVGIILLGIIAIWGGIRLALSTDYPVLVVSSPSMCPPTNCVLPVGALIMIKGQDPATVQVGTIIVFRPYDSNPGYLVVHRVVQVITADQASCGQIEFKTKGDANYGPDNWPDCRDGGITGSRLAGVYQGTIPIPYLGSTILAIRSFCFDENMGQPNTQCYLIIVSLIVALIAFEILTPTKKTPDKDKESVETEPETATVPDAKLDH